MTGGRAVVLGDPGPWICAGMTGGRIYQCMYPEYGFDTKALERRVARSANVEIAALDDNGVADVENLLGMYIQELKGSFQDAEAAEVEEILMQAADRFVVIVPKAVKPLSAE
jgi:glutamate synthase (NADPH/NADH) large chain